MNILITGASSGFGMELAFKYANELNNVTLYLIARRKEKLEAVQEHINEISTKNKKNIQVYLGIGDVCDKDFVRSFANSLYIDILVNNAGLARGIDSTDKIPFQDWEEMIAVNITALSFLTHIILPNMLKQGRGHIVNIGSIAGTYPYYGSSVYGASKAFVKQFSRNLRAELYDKNIRVTNIEPGLCNGSDFSLTRFHGDKQKADLVYENTIPLNAKDIAEAIFWATSQPQHVNINHIELMPTTQASAGLVVHKKNKKS
ncbi:SDR family NAD(P)-dependent oxidoreductase [Helicobacter muridarum]|uniref:Oxidoreductase n=1 Tax=Helicobacter muridarum TaxID=216 RepID=A0A099TWB8_9HELI|nr:SDR family NAD(P)-dependent oxidoreductase [Helicobacter muridarum]TLE00059.1 SDR family NAD(P)-dependent oxidoreductase [Helicobacter muridarum]STQ86094.1 oxidoreductase [Helicobacter muridarum]